MQEAFLNVVQKTEPLSDALKICKLCLFVIFYYALGVNCERQNPSKNIAERDGQQVKKTPLRGR